MRSRTRLDEPTTRGGGDPLRAAAGAGLGGERAGAGRADDERGAAPPGGGQRREDEAVAALGEDRPARRERVGARPRGRRDDDAVAGEADVELVVDVDA